MNIGLMKLITSIQNEQVKNWRKLQTKKYRTRTGQFIIEGHHLIEEAIHSNFTMETIIVNEQAAISKSWSDYAITHVSDEVFKSITQTSTPQGVAAVVHMKEINERDGGPVLILDGLQDPGNVGTIIRTADAAGVAKILIGKGTVDVYNDKVIRATQGSLFHIRIEEVETNEAVAALQVAGYTVWASALEGAKPLKEIDFSQKSALIVGNEGAGIQQTILDKADGKVKIPIYGQAESLNVSVATGILLYEMVK